MPAGEEAGIKDIHSGYNKNKQIKYIHCLNKNMNTKFKQQQGQYPIMNKLKIIFSDHYYVYYFPIKHKYKQQIYLMMAWRANNSQFPHIRLLIYV